MARGHLHVSMNWPGLDEIQGFECVIQPQVSQDLHLPPQLQPLLSLRAAQQTCPLKRATSLMLSFCMSVLVNKLCKNELQDNIWLSIPKKKHLHIQNALL